MLDNRGELLEAIRLGETSFLELKEVRFSGLKVAGPSRDDLADEIAAFANSRGGVLVLGVEDSSRDIIGVPDDRLDAVVNFAKEICNDSITPPVEQFVLDRVSLPSATGRMASVVKLEVPRSLFVHRSPGGYWHRAGDSKRIMTPDLLARLFQQRSQTRLIRFDEQAVTNARIGDLSEELWARFRTPRSDHEPETFLAKLGMAVRAHDGAVRPSVAGVLIGSDAPEQWLPNAYVQAVAYRGTSVLPESVAMNYQLDASDFTGPLDRQVIEASRFVSKNMRQGASKVVGRVDEPQFDMAAVFEALVNAVAHRDYAIHGAKIRLRLFDDRLELFSPGALANSLTVDSLRYRQTARNETVCSLLTRCTAPDEPWLTIGRAHLMEKRGEGVPIILDSSTALSGREPEYRVLDDAELMLTIHSANKNPSVADGG
ncbi:MAG: putative DNA binding domain-containing protein [Acidimicrobiaceae bacterium]|nr:putative DNA binding domain-containing protein [Acidimicrobiia bacterium]MCY4494314.1 putative DNA binding domain-containing protein [Acidimicrobiaceae bacterium]